jgi:hypothetical protein
MKTHTVPSSTNISWRGSFIRFLHNQSIRKPTLAGKFVEGSVEGRAILWERCEEKRSSRPPLWYTDIRFDGAIALYGCDRKTYVNSSLMGIVDAIIA